MTTLVALLGYPASHSRSPDMHNEAFAALGIDWRYEAIEVEPERFEDVMRRLPASGFAGANVTIPHKLRALELADHASEVALAVGAANTLSFRDGAIHADNTDVGGFLAALEERAPGAPAGMNALVLGAGGAARAVVFALLRAGAAAVEVWNRTPARAEKLAADLAAAAGGVPLTAVRRPSLAQCELMVNATSVGMGERGALSGSAEDRVEDFKELPIPADELRDLTVIVDLVYRDGGTALVREARAQGLSCVDGLDVLVHQGAASFELWTGRPAPLAAMRNGARKRDQRPD